MGDLYQPPRTHPTHILAQWKKGVERIQEPEDGKAAVKCCLLDMTWPMYSRVHYSHGDLFKIKPTRSVQTAPDRKATTLYHSQAGILTLVTHFQP